MTQPPGDIRWPSSNDLEIPDLLLERAPAGPDLPLVAWGTRSRAAKFRGCWHFYVEDYRFTQAWAYPEKVVETGAAACCEVNYSLFDQTPFPVALWAIYRKRWLARYWQEMGMGVWVDLNVSETHSDLNLLGVPRGWRHYVTRGYEERIDDMRREIALAHEHAGREAIVLVYGGGRAVAEALKSERGALHFPETASPKTFRRPALQVVNG